MPLRAFYDLNVSNKLTDIEEQKLTKVRAYIRAKFDEESTGHDWFHIQRVVNVSLKIARKEGADLFVTELGALLHDIADHKFYGGDLQVGPEQAKELMQQFEIDPSDRKRVVAIVEEVSFKGADVKTPVSSIESACVQDADRLDALGAVGIGRTFAYGGSVGNPMHDPDREPQRHGDFESYASSKNSTINHFYEKLLLLKDRMNTKTGTELAKERHSYMEEFLKRFYSEWKGEA